MLLRRRHFLLSRGYAIARPLRVNEQIRIRTVRVIDENGEQLGIMPTEEAFARARAAGLDLIEISPTAQPPSMRPAFSGLGKFSSVRARNFMPPVITHMRGGEDVGQALYFFSMP